MTDIYTILNNIKFSYNVSKNQNNLFTAYHTKFNCTITYNNIICKFDYQCNTKYITPNMKDCLYSLFRDADVYDDSINFEDFAANLGYNLNCTDDYKKAKKSYSGCGKAYRKLTSMFSADELETLKAYFQEY